MKHITLLLCTLFTVCLFSCNFQKRTAKKMDSFIGMSKADIMMRYGLAPVKDGWVEGLGRVLAYTDIKTSGFGVYAQQYYKHTVFVLNQDFKCIGWSVRNEQMPFDRLDVRIFRTSF